MFRPDPLVSAVGLIAAIIGLLVWAAPARATGYEHMVVIKKVVVVTTASSPAAAAVAPTAASPVAAAAAPAQQPATGGGGSSWLASGGLAFIGTGIFLTAAGVSHFIFCAQREEEWHRDNKVARCYNAERDGLPEARR
jgi:hypothetical protein